MSETRKIAAILVSDVVGYSRLAGADEERILARLRALRSDLIDPTISVHHGRIVKRTGDGSIIEFNSVVDAVRCAIEVQRAMVERNAGVAPDNRIAFRIGIHLGDIVEESDGDLMGDGVNIAARLEGLCEPGGVCLSEDAHRQVRDRLKENFVDLGERQLKNIARPVRAYALPAAAIAGSKDQGPRATRVSALRGGGRWIGVIAACVAALLAAGWFGWRAWTPSQTAALTASSDKLATAPRLSIVVLPFENLSGDKEQDYFADGITDDLTTDLSHLARQLRHRPQHRVHLQGQASRREADRPRARRALSARRQRAPPRGQDRGQRPAHLDRDRRACLGRPLRRRAEQTRPIAG